MVAAVAVGIGVVVVVIVTGIDVVVIVVDGSVLCVVCRRAGGCVYAYVGGRKCICLVGWLVGWWVGCFVG